jgi:hypothetical protein
MGFMTVVAKSAALLALLALGACNVWQWQPEFAAPQSRWPWTLPYPAPANAPPPPVQTVHCYRTLAQVECFREPQPDRVTSYTGTYPAN